MKLPILDPHRVLKFLHERVGIQFDPEVTSHCWTTAAANGLGFAASQPYLAAVPIGFYADETKFGLQESQEKILAFFVNTVLFRPQNIRLSRFLLGTVRSDHLPHTEPHGLEFELGQPWAFSQTPMLLGTLCHLNKLQKL